MSVAASSKPDVVYALHDFEAENPDEVSFKAGEAVIVVEKDDAYGDGWWQGTNARGQTGLFPFSYTTFDKELAMNAQQLAAVEGGAGSASGDGTDHVSGGAKPSSQAVNGSQTPGVMGSTMADIDAALAGLKSPSSSGGGGGGGGGQPGSVLRKGSTDNPSAASVASERTADLSETDDDATGGNIEDEYESRARARAALAVNATKAAASANERERAEEERRKLEAQRLFELEEEKHRKLLLAKEEEHKRRLEQGILPEEGSAPKQPPPIDGVEMSDESDSEGSVTGGGGGGASGPAVRPRGASLANGSPKAAMRQESLLGSPAVQGRSLSPIPSASDHPVGNGAVGGVASSSQQQKTASESVVAPPTSSTPPPTKRGSAVGIAASSSSPVHPERNAPTPVQQQHAAARAFDERSVDSSTRHDGRQSLGVESTATTVAGGATTAPTTVLGSETPKSPGAALAAAAAGGGARSPANSIAGGRGAAALSPSPGGDPHEWSVEQVVEWGRSKGWDEATVVSKFAEHEISGDVLMEMDVNILKEIEIVAFGKRFQVANAIKELKRSVDPSAAAAANLSVASGGSEVAGLGGFVPVASSPNLSQTGFSPSASSADAAQRLTSPAGTSQTFLTSASTTATLPGGGDSAPSYQGLLRAGSPPAASEGEWAKPRNFTDESQAVSLASLGAGAAAGGQPMFSPGSAPLDGSGSFESASGWRPASGEIAKSPRRRELLGTNGRGQQPGDRTSFFAGLHPRNRKPPPRASGMVQGDDAGGGAGGGGVAKGTLSRLGLNRLRDRNSANSTASSSVDNSGGGAAPSSSSAAAAAQQQLKEKISLPTSSPMYDSMGDTARRHRASQQSAGSGGAPPPSSYTTAWAAGHAKQASVGSVGPQADVETGMDQPRSALGGAVGGGAGGAGSEGPVMARIRPVDHEGWMRKKGERYNSWKPRYMALKGTDLVLLRDPSAAKIKAYVSTRGYKVLADENANPGRYGFKLLHETERPHYFSSEDPVVVREWMKALMKSTIGRDTSLPVISSYNNATISLREAQRMNPPPRPPSPNSRARAQRATVRANTTQLTAKDASVLMGLGQPGTKPLGIRKDVRLAQPQCNVGAAAHAATSRRGWASESPATGAAAAAAAATASVDEVWRRKRLSVTGSISLGGATRLARKASVRRRSVDDRGAGGGGGGGGGISGVDGAAAESVEAAAATGGKVGGMARTKSKRKIASSRGNVAARSRRGEADGEAAVAVAETAAATGERSGDVDDKAAKEAGDEDEYYEESDDDGSDLRHRLYQDDDEEDEEEALGWLVELQARLARARQEASSDAAPQARPSTDAKKAEAQADVAPAGGSQSTTFVVTSAAGETVGVEEAAAAQQEHMELKRRVQLVRVESRRRRPAGRGASIDFGRFGIGLASALSNTTTTTTTNNAASSTAAEAAAAGAAPAIDVVSPESASTATPEARRGATRREAEDAQQRRTVGRAHVEAGHAAASQPADAGAGAGADGAAMEITDYHAASAGAGLSASMVEEWTRTLREVKEVTEAACSLELGAEDAMRSSSTGHRGGEDDVGRAEEAEGDRQDELALDGVTAGNVVDRLALPKLSAGCRPRDTFGAVADSARSSTQTMEQLLTPSTADMEKAGMPYSWIANAPGLGRQPQQQQAQQNHQQHRRSSDPKAHPNLGRETSHDQQQQQQQQQRQRKSTTQEAHAAEHELRDALARPGANLAGVAPQSSQPSATGSRARLRQANADTSAAEGQAGAQGPCHASLDEPHSRRTPASLRDEVRPVVRPKTSGAEAGGAGHSRFASPSYEPHLRQEHRPGKMANHDSSFSSSTQHFSREPHGVLHPNAHQARADVGPRRPARDNSELSYLSQPASPGNHISGQRRPEQVEPHEGAPHGHQHPPRHLPLPYRNRWEGPPKPFEEPITPASPGLEGPRPPSAHDHFFPADQPAAPPDPLLTELPAANVGALAPRQRSLSSKSANAAAAARRPWTASGQTQSASPAFAAAPRRDGGHVQAATPPAGDGRDVVVGAALHHGQRLGERRSFCAPDDAQRMYAPPQRHHAQPELHPIQAGAQQRLRAGYPTGGAGVASMPFPPSLPSSASPPSSGSGGVGGFPSPQPLPASPLDSALPYSASSSRSPNAELAPPSASFARQANKASTGSNASATSARSGRSARSARPSTTSAVQPSFPSLQQQELQHQRQHQHQQLHHHQQLLQQHQQPSHQYYPRQQVHVPGQPARGAVQSSPLRQASFSSIPTDPSSMDAALPHPPRARHASPMSLDSRRPMPPHPLEARFSPGTPSPLASAASLDTDAMPTSPRRKLRKLASWLKGGKSERPGSSSASSNATGTPPASRGGGASSPMFGFQHPPPLGTVTEVRMESPPPPASSQRDGASSRASAHSPYLGDTPGSPGSAARNPASRSEDVPAACDEAHKRPPPLLRAKQSSSTPSIRDRITKRPHTAGGAASGGGDGGGTFPRHGAAAAANALSVAQPLPTERTGRRSISAQDLATASLWEPGVSVGATPPAVAVVENSPAGRTEATGRPRMRLFNRSEQGPTPRASETGLATRASRQASEPGGTRGAPATEECGAVVDPRAWTESSSARSAVADRGGLAHGEGAGGSAAQRRRGGFQVVSRSQVDLRRTPQAPPQRVDAPPGVTQGFAAADASQRPPLQAASRQWPSPDQPAYPPTSHNHMQRQQQQHHHHHHLHNNHGHLGHYQYQQEQQQQAALHRSDAYSAELQPPQLPYVRRTVRSNPTPLAHALSSSPAPSPASSRPGTPHSRVEGQAQSQPTGASSPPPLPPSTPTTHGAASEFGAPKAAGTTTTKKAAAGAEVGETSPSSRDRKRSFATVGPTSRFKFGGLRSRSGSVATAGSSPRR